MATAPKRGRGRPPLSEKEKAKRAEKKAQEKAEKKAKTEARQERAYQARLAQQRKVRSQVRQKIAEQQMGLLQRASELNVSDLAIRLEGEEDKRILGMKAAKYFGELPKVDMDNPMEVQHRLDFFFDACIEAGVQPVIEWIALVLGIQWNSLRDIMNGNRRDGSPQQELIAKTILQMQSMWAFNGLYGQENPAEWIFRAKNYFGMKDTVDVAVAPPKQELGDAQSSEQLAQKYQTALPKGIDVEFKEVDN